jgi:hypothetical protein
MKMTTPESIDVVQVHYYEDPNITYGRQLKASRDLKVYKKAADQMNKPLLVGEIGLSWTMADVNSYNSPKAIEHATRLIDAAVDSGSPLILFWSYSNDSPDFKDKAFQWNMRYGKIDKILKVIETASKKMKEI